MDDCAQLVWVRNDAFEADWTPEAYRDRVMRKPGYRPECEILALAPDGQVAALTVIWLDPVNKIGMFEPVATRSAGELYRRLGFQKRYETLGYGRQ